jgi:hypothetical protein
MLKIGSTHRFGSDGEYGPSVLRLLREGHGPDQGNSSEDSEHDIGRVGHSVGVLHLVSFNSKVLHCLDGMVFYHVNQRML